MQETITIDKYVYDDLVKVTTWVKERQWEPSGFAPQVNTVVPIEIRAAASSAWEHTLPLKGQK